VEDLCKKSAKIHNKHQVHHRLRKKCIQTHNPFTFKHTYQRIQRCRDKSFIATRLLSPRESFNCEPSSKDETKMEKKGNCLLQTKKSQTQRHNQETRVLLKLYSRELSSTIDRYKNGKNAYIYSEQQQQRNQENALKVLHLHGF
jgi:hypothetical protein